MKERQDERANSKNPKSDRRVEARQGSGAQDQSGGRRDDEETKEHSNLPALKPGSFSYRRDLSAVR